MKIYVYLIYFPISDKYYIGQTAYLERRMQQHFKSGSLICKALWKYDDWIVKILHTTKDKDIANRIEIEEIRNFNSVVPNGYNITRGGEGTAGLKRLDTIRRNKEGHSKEAKEKIKQAHQGTHHSKETIEKIKQAQIGNQYAKGKNLGNQNAKGCKYSEESLEKRRGKNNCSHRVDVKIKRLKTRIKKYEQELN